MYCFNSILVQLNFIAEFRARIRKPEFQFHSGSIKFRLDTADRRFRNAFQFHSGSIKFADDPDIKRNRL